MLKPKWLGLFAVLVVLLVAFTFLGLWQLSVARNEAQRVAIDAAAAQAPVPLGQVLSPHTAFPAEASGRPVTAIGRFDAGDQVLVADRRLDGASGWWVVTPLVVDGSAARIAILRGFVSSAASTGPAPADVGQVTVTGTLAPGESPVSGAELPAGQLASLDLARLVNVWPGELYNAFVFATAESPDASPGLQRVPPPAIPSGLTWRNAAYAVQWWVFGLFAAWMWWKMVRDDHRREQASAGTKPSSSDSVRPAGATT
jgi:cytochrome oxidase assembly protein ShyY1